jgi:hypothetical protein
VKAHLSLVRLAAAAFFFCALISSGCGDLIVGEPDRTDNVVDFEAAWSITKSVYPYFEFKGINWDSLHTVYRARAERSKGDEIFAVLFDLLAELRDGHVGLTTKGGYYVQTYQPPRTVRDRFAFDPLVVRKYFHQELKLAGDKNMEYEILSGNIGYVRISTFTAGGWIQEFHGVLSYLRNTKALIIDVRNNGGGSTNTSDVVVSRFLNSPLPYAPIYIKGQLQPSFFLQPRGPFRYANAVVVLINGVCFSTTEDFVEMMKQIPTVTVIGDTTGGGSGAPEYFSLPSGKQIRVSMKDIRRYDGLPIEWNGVAPHVRVAQTVFDVRAGRDKQLEYALALLQ